MTKLRRVSVVAWTREVYGSVRVRECTSGVVRDINGLPVAVVEGSCLGRLECADELRPCITHSCLESISAWTWHLVLLLHSESRERWQTECCCTCVLDRGDEVLAHWVCVHLGFIGSWTWVLSDGCEQHYRE